MHPRQEVEDPKERKQKQFSLPHTLKKPLSEVLQTNFVKQDRVQPKLDNGNYSVTRRLPYALMADVKKYLRLGAVYNDNWLTVRYYFPPDTDLYKEGLMGVHTERSGCYSHVTLEVENGRLAQIHVNCSKAMLTRMLKNGLPKELKDAMRYAREIM